MTALPKPARIRDEAYLDYVRGLHCIAACLHKAEPHHVDLPGQAKTGSKANDDRTVPMCRAHHRELHDIGIARFEAIYELSLEAAILETRRGYRPPKRSRTVEQKPKVLHIAVRCICKQIHKLPPSKVNGGWQCPISRQRVEA